MSALGFLRNRNLLFFSSGFISALAAISLYRLIFDTSSNSNRLLVNTRKRVLFFGDSITQHGFNVDIRGWVSQLGNWWTRRVDLLNRGFSGYNSRWGRLIVEKVVIEENPDFVFVFFGANDAVDPIVLQHVPLIEYEENLREIIEKIRKSLQKVPVILITPPPVWEEKLEHFNKMKGKKLLIDRSNDRTLQYAEVCLRLGKEYSIPVADIWTAMEGASEARAEYLSDGLHINSKGSDKVFEILKNIVLKSYPDWNPEVMKMHLLEWSQIDSGKNPTIV